MIEGEEMSVKSKRQEKILELIRKYDIETQDELLGRLGEVGIRTTQATVSRDIRDLKLAKVTTPDGAYKYVKSGARAGAGMAKLNTSVIGSITSVDYSSCMLVIKTIPSMASAVAAGIDDMELRQVLGCVAGDDCIIAVARTEEDAAAICRRLRELIRAT